MVLLSFNDFDVLISNILKKYFHIKTLLKNILHHNTKQTLNKFF